MDLPDECWELIFDRLDRHHLLDSISLVSKRFLSISSCFIQTLTISDPDRFLRHCDISKLFGTRFKHIKRLHITNPWWSSSSEGVIDLIVVEIARSGLDNLEHLSISNFEEITPSAIEELGSKMSNNLKSLALNYFGLNDCILIAISKFLPGLHELDISHPDEKTGNYFMNTKNVTDEGIGALASNLKQLRKINLSGQRFPELNMSYLALFSNCGFLNEFAPSLMEEDAAFALQNCPNLNSLSIVEFPCYRDVLLLFKNFFSYARALRAIEISCYTDRLLCLLAQARLPLLKKLKLNNCSQITDTGLSTHFQQYKSLNELHLEEMQNLADDHINHCSKYLSDLTHINLSRCPRLTNSTFFILARSCPLLTNFVMDSTSLGKEGHLLPTNYLSKHSQVQFLELSRNEFLNDETILKIASICPSLVLLNLSYNHRITTKTFCKIWKYCPGIKHLKVYEALSENMILGTHTENSKLNIEVLETSMGDDRGIAMIGMRCPDLLKLNFLPYPRVTAEGVKEVVRKCLKLREINLTMCENIDVSVLYWMLSTSLSLRRIILPNGSRVTEEDRIYFMRHGCQLLGMCEHSLKQKYKLAT